jgi:tetratricopeptide (TPR) repeat protein/predicted aspartyl protease
LKVYEGIRAIALALCGSLLPFASYATCKREALDLPVTITGTRPSITAKINGVEAHFIIDSGAFFSMISSAAADEFNLKKELAPYGFTLGGAVGGGRIVPSVATVKEFTLAQIDIPHVEFLVGGTEIGSGSIGLLGQNFLTKWDVEYDLAHGMIRLLKEEGCSKALLAYWLTPGQSYTLTNIQRATPREPYAIASAYVNGAKIHVILDSGAALSVLSLRAAERAGVKPEDPGVVDGGLSRGIGRGMVKSYIAPFASFKFADGEEIQHTKLRIAKLDIEQADMLLGADFLLSHRVLVANSQNKMYFTYNGGPVFNLSTSASKPTQSTSTGAENSAADGATLADDAAVAENPTAPTETKKNANDPVDASAWARRGTASAGRNDFEHAIADLTRACELEPNNPDYFFERGEVYWRSKNPEKAMDDFNRVLQLKPDHVPALMSRAQLRINVKDNSEARADLDAVQRLAAKQADVRFELAFAYQRAQFLPAAITQFDLWISSHQEDARLPNALNGRCRAKGLLSVDLPAALKDCNTAVGRSVKGTDAAALENRALVRYRLGDFAKSIADYDESLKLQPNAAWMLYGRGMAKLRANKTNEGEADISEALKIAPGVAGAYQKIGIAP